MTKPPVRAYWNENRKRWKRLLLVAADLADMYELQRPDRALLRSPEPYRHDLVEFVEGMFWRTTHRSFPRTVKGMPIADPLIDSPPEFDGVTCFACTVGLLRANFAVSGDDLRHILNISGQRQIDALARWRGYSEDFRYMMRCLSGDMAKPALRSLVLGNDWSVMR